MSGDMECEGDEVEARHAERRRPARLPTEDEVRFHRVSRLPFHDWCEECVPAHGRDWPGRASLRREELRELAIHMGYC